MAETQCYADKDDAEDAEQVVPSQRAPRSAAAAAPKPRARRLTAKQVETKEERAALRRQRLALRRPAGAPQPDVFRRGRLPVTVPEEFSISKAQLKNYTEEATEALSWALLQDKWAKANLDDPEVLDLAVTDYLACLFDQGESKATAAAALFRTIFVKGLP